MLLVALVVVLIIVVVGVGIVVVANPFAPKQPAQGSQTVWQAITDKIHDGQASKEVALQAFAYAYKVDIPGVQVPAGIKDTDVPEDGSLVTKWVQQHWTELTPAQQSAINPYLTAGPNDTVITINLQPPVGTSRNSRSLAYEQAPAPPRALSRGQGRPF